MMPARGNLGLMQWLRRRSTPAQPKDPLTPMQRYAQEFIAASRWSARHGIEQSPVRPQPRPDFIDKGKADPVLQRLLGHYENQDLVSQALAVQMLLLRELSVAIEVPLMLTMGWFEIEGKASYQHGEELRLKLVEEGGAPFLVDGLPFHVWLTSPAFEVIDATLPTILAQVTGNQNLARRVVYLSNQTPNPRVIYHPTIVGDRFLVDIGVAVDLG